MIIMMTPPYIVWHEILVGVIFGEFFSQDWRIIIWRTNLDRALHALAYTLAEFNFDGSFIQLPIRQINFSTNISCCTVVLKPI